MPAHPLRIRNFRAYWTARFAMTLAQNAMIIVIGWQTYMVARASMAMPEAAAQLGLMGLLQFLPLFLTTPVSGWVADRLDRRWIIRATVSLQFVCALTLALFTAADAMALPVLYVVAVVLGLARAFSGPAASALAPNLVPREILPQAIALSSIASQVGSIIGPAIGGYAYALAPANAYWIATLLFGIAVAAMFCIGPVARPAIGSAHPLRQLVAGLSYVRHNKLLLGTITLDLFAVFLAGTTALLPIYAHDILHVGAAGLSLLATAPAIGAAATAILLVLRPLQRNVGVRMLAAVLIYGLATIAFGLSRNFILSMTALTVVGASDMVSVYIRQSLVQLNTPDAMRGRVGAVYQLTISASNELGEAESGFLAAAFGPVGAVLIGGGGAIVVTLLWAGLFPGIRRARSFEPPVALDPALANPDANGGRSG